MGPGGQALDLAWPVPWNPVPGHSQVSRELPMPSVKAGLFSPLEEQNSVHLQGSQKGMEEGCFVWGLDVVGTEFHTATWALMVSENLSRGVQGPLSCPGHAR